MGTTSTRSRRRCDFRKVYASLIEGWLGTDANEVIPSANAYGRLALVR